MTTALEGGEGSASRPGRSLTPGKTRYPLYRRLDGLQGRSGQVRKISPPPGFDPRTVQTRSQSLYRLRYPVHCMMHWKDGKCLRNFSRKSLRYYSTWIPWVGWGEILILSSISNMWIIFRWVVLQTCGGHLWVRWGTFGFHKCGEFLD